MSLDDSQTHRCGNKTVHNQIFAAWMVNTFGQLLLRQGGGVVDIAGGLGLISFELCVRYGVKCTLIEPRAVKLKALTRRYGKKVHRNRLRAKTNWPEKMVELREDDPAEKKSLIGFIHSLYPTLEDDLVIDENVEILGLEESRLPFIHIRAMFKWPQQESDESNPEILKALVFASVVIGVHSDGATEAIVDAALALDKPFAVVPCCVFPTENPHRAMIKNEDGTTTYFSLSDRDVSTEEGVCPPPMPRTKAGIINRRSIVTSTEDFIGYLQSKDPSIRRANLPFLGRNTVLYRLSCASSGV